VTALVVHSAGIQDRDGAKKVFEAMGGAFGRLRRVWADGGYAGRLAVWVNALKGTWKLVLDVVKRRDDAVGFEVIRKRWIVERTFGWLHNSRRLSKDYEFLPENSEAMIRLSMIHLMLDRLCERRAS
jgi:putative transposase